MIQSLKQSFSTSHITQKERVAKMTQEILNVETVETNSASNGETANTSKETKKSSFAGKVSEVTEIGGYVSGTYASSFLTEKAGKNIPVTTVNNLAYNGKIEAVKIAGVFLFKKSGEHSLEAYVPQLHLKNEKEKEKEHQNAIKVKQGKVTELARLHKEALASGKAFNYIEEAKKLGIEI